MSQLEIVRNRSEAWTVTFRNPPINLLDDSTIVELRDLLTQIEQEANLKVIVFESADPDFFIAHYDVSQPARGTPDDRPWRDFILRLSNVPVVSIAKIRGRARGAGNEFLLACDIRFASRERAIFGQPEVGAGLIPGGGALEWLPRLIGRSRALEIVLGADDLDAEMAERYGMINRAVDDVSLDTFADAFASRIASFDKPALQMAKGLINRVGIPEGEAFERSNLAFRQTLTWESTLARLAKQRELGMGERSELEFQLGKALAPSDLIP